jgi:MSHA biogenesis protein MshK
MARRLNVIFSALILLGWAGTAGAQLNDPTRPPGDAALQAEAGTGMAVPGGLQSVILRQHGKPAALINGEVVELGGKVGEARLVKVNEDSVVLKGPGGEEILRLMPAAEKKKVGAGRTAQTAGKDGEREKTR